MRFLIYISIIFFSFNKTYAQFGCINGNCENGIGTYTWENGSDKYIGQFKNGLLGGEGTYYWSNGDTFEGNFTENEMNGIGKMTWADGYSYSGLWMNNRMSGKCAFFKDNEVLWEGKWKSNTVSLDKMEQTPLPKPISPPNLIIENIIFKEISGNGNNILDANEKAEISFVINNKGKGIAYQLHAFTIDKSRINGIDYYNDQAFDNSFQVLPGEKKTISIPLFGDMNLESGTTNFIVYLKEGNGFNADLFNVSFTTQKFKNPKIIVSDYKFTSNEEGKIKLGYPVTLNLVVQNVGQGEANDVKVNFINPLNVYPGSSSIENIGRLLPNESKYLAYDFFASKIYKGNTIPIEVLVTENYNLYGEKKITSVSLDQNLPVTQEFNFKSKTENLVQINKVYLGSDVDKDIPSVLKANPKKYALIIGCEDYAKFQTNLDKEVNVDFAANDALVFTEYAEKTLGFPKDQIYTLINPTTSQVKQNIDKLQKAIEIEKGKAEIIFYYSGHGLPEPNTQEPFLIPVDVNGNNPQDGVSLVDVYAKLSKFPTAKATVILDACFSGGARNKELVALKGIKVRPKMDAVAGNLVVFASCKGTESSAVYKEKQHGYFTYFLLKNLKEKSINQSFNELFIEVNYQVSKEALKIGKTQTPDVLPGIELGDKWKTLTW
jgi:hypothetical protein